MTSDLIEQISTQRTYRTIQQVAGPLLFVEDVTGVSFGEIVSVEDPMGEKRTGQVLEVSSRIAVVQVFEGLYYLLLFHLHLYALQYEPVWNF